MQFLVSAKWIEGEAKERGISATPAEVAAPVQADQGPVVPEREGLPALPEDFRPDRGGPPLPRPPRRALQQDPRAGHRGAARTSPTARSRTTTTRTSSSSRSPSGATSRSILTKTQAKAQEAQAARRGRRELVRRSPRTFRSTPPRRSQGGKLLGVTKGQQDPKPSTPRCSPRVEEQDRRPDQDRRRLLRLPRHQGHPGDEAEPRAVQAGHQAAAGLAEAAEEARPASRPTSATSGARAPTARRTT